MSKRILIATGGTGGHVYPAIALAQQLQLELPGCEILFVGGGLATNRYFDRAAFSYRNVSAGALSSLSPKTIAISLFNISKGVWQSQRIIREFRPDVVVGFGSFYAFPPMVAAKLLSVPLVLHEANSIPGKVNRLASYWADITGVHFPETVHLLKGKSIEVGMPLRQGFIQPLLSKNAAREHFGLKADLTTLLVFGGSQGARAINLLMEQALSADICSRPFQVLHIAGDSTMAQELKRSYAKANILAIVKPFEEHMELAWRAADMVICRSGAGTIAEQLEFEVPGILIPYPRAADNHQEHNADFMVASVGGAAKLLEKGLTLERLKSCVREFLKDDGEVLAAMRRSMQAYKKRARTKDLCALVREQF